MMIIVLNKTLHEPSIPIGVLLNTISVIMYNTTCYSISDCASLKPCKTETRQIHFLVSDAFRMKKLQQKVTSSLILNLQRHSNALLCSQSVVLCYYVVLIWQQNGQAAPFIQDLGAIFTGRRCRKCSRQC